MEIKDIYWIAALLDGEGYFGGRDQNLGRITLRMTDYDTVSRARDIMNPRAHIHTSKFVGSNNQYDFSLYGHYAIGWMMIIYCHPYTSARRKEQIKQVLSNWRNVKPRDGFTTATGKALIRAIARKHAIPQQEVKKRLYSGKYTMDAMGRTYIG